MKSLNTYIIEKFRVSADTKYNNERTVKGVKINNDTNCEALSTEYVDALIDAYLESKLRLKTITNIDVHTTTDFLDTLDDFDKANAKNHCERLVKRQYPAITFTLAFDGPRKNTPPKGKTIATKLPRIEMPLILTDCKGLFHRRNAIRLIGVDDVDVWYVFYDTSQWRKDGILKYTLAYILKPSATEKLLPVSEFKKNLKNYYNAGGEAIRREYLEKIEDDFYKIDDRTNSHGWLNISNERQKECWAHLSDTWK